MSILINMEMPKRCEDCPVCHKYETVTAIACGCKINMRTREIGCVTRPDWCPLIEVPIDYDELLKAAKAMHTWIFLNSVDEQEAYDECGLTDEMNAILGYAGSFTAISADKEGYE